MLLVILHAHNLNDKKSKIDHYSDKEALDFPYKRKVGQNWDKLFKTINN